ncbi:MAG: TonB-dependent receptor plug domain-containing protein, partial [bacterium]
MYRCGRKNMIILLALALIVLSSGIAQAEDEIEFELDKVVVTATKTQTKLKDVPSSVEVITREDLEKRHVRMLSDALKTLPGVYIRNAKGLIGDNNSEVISMRGFIGKGYVAFLVDGQPINNGYSGSVDFSNIPVENIERIEVIKGSASVLYGSNAMGGVINVITKSKPEEAVTIHTSVGEMGTRSGAVSASGSAGSLDYFLDVQKIKIDGYVTTRETDGKNGMERENYGTKLVYHFDDRSKLAVTADKSNHDYFYEKSPNAGSVDQDRISLAYENQFDAKNYLRAAFSRNDWDGWSVFNSKDASEKASSKQFDLQYNYKLSERDLLTFGYVYKREKADDIFDGPNSEDKKLTGGQTETHSFYIQDKHLLNDRTDLYLGLRYDYWQLKDAYNYK